MSKTKDQIQAVMEKFQITLLHSDYKKYLVHTSSLSCWSVPGFRLTMNEGMGCDSVQLSLDGPENYASASFCFGEGGLTTFELTLIETFAIGSLNLDIMFLDEDSTESNHYHGNRQILVAISRIPYSLEDLKESVRTEVYNEVYNNVEYPVEWSYCNLDKLAKSFDSAVRQAYDCVSAETIKSQAYYLDKPLRFLVSW